MNIAELKKLAEEGKHIDIAPNGDITISDKQPRPTIKEQLAINELRDIAEGTIRFECDMDKGSYLEILREGDGDLILTISSHGISGIRRTASMQICTPGQGGGKHEKLWRALARIYKIEMGEEVLPQLDN